MTNCTEEFYFVAFNLCSYLVGINQIRNMYITLLKRSAMDELGIEGGEGGA